jgi:protein phosphatase
MISTKLGESLWEPEFYCWAASDLGRVRLNNEDCWAASGDPATQAAACWQGTLGKRNAWALVADGMGGHAAGEIASSLATECLRTVLPSLSSEEEIRSAIEATNLALHEAMQTQPKLRGMGTTLAGIIARDTSAMLFNAGDSRIYIANSGALIRVSEDHVVRGNLLTKCLGGSSLPAPVDPFVRSVQLSRGCRILLCTDGLTDELQDEEIAELVTMDKPAERLVEAALESGGRDNVTVVVIEAS